MAHSEQDGKFRPEKGREQTQLRDFIEQELELMEELDGKDDLKVGVR